MTQDDYGYYAIRARQEDAAARVAACHAARERHEELAEAYRLRCQLIRGLFSTTIPEGSLKEPSSGFHARPWAVPAPVTLTSSAAPSAAVIA